MRMGLIAEQMCDRAGEPALSTAFWGRVGKGGYPVSTAGSGPLLVQECCLVTNFRAK